MSGDPFTFEPYPSAGPTAPPPPETRTGDVVLTVVELVVLGLAALLVTAPRGPGGVPGRGPATAVGRER